MVAIFGAALAVAACRSGSSAQDGCDVAVVTSPDGRSGIAGCPPLIAPIPTAAPASPQPDTRGDDKKENGKGKGKGR